MPATRRRRSGSLGPGSRRGRRSRVPDRGVGAWRRWLAASTCAQAFRPTATAKPSWTSACRIASASRSTRGARGRAGRLTARQDPACSSAGHLVDVRPPHRVASRQHAKITRCAAVAAVATAAMVRCGPRTRTRRDRGGEKAGTTSSGSEQPRAQRRQAQPISFSGSGRSGALRGTRRHDRQDPFRTSLLAAVVTSTLAFRPFSRC